MKATDNKFWNVHATVPYSCFFGIFPTNKNQDSLWRQTFASVTSFFDFLATLLVNQN